MLPSLGSHPVMIPLIVQTIMPMLHEDAKPYVPTQRKHPLCFSFYIFMIILVALTCDCMQPQNMQSQVYLSKTFDCMFYGNFAQSWSVVIKHILDVDA